VTTARRLPLHSTIFSCVLCERGMLHARGGEGPPRGVPWDPAPRARRETSAHVARGFNNIATILSEQEQLVKALNLKMFNTTPEKSWAPCHDVCSSRACASQSVALGLHVFQSTSGPKGLSLSLPGQTSQDSTPIRSAQHRTRSKDHARSSLTFSLPRAHPFVSASVAGAAVISPLLPPLALWVASIMI
jgi:hypothetical protein